MSFALYRDANGQSAICFDNFTIYRIAQKRKPHDAYQLWGFRETGGKGRIEPSTRGFSLDKTAVQ